MHEVQRFSFHREFQLTRGKFRGAKRRSTALIILHWLGRGFGNQLELWTNQDQGTRKAVHSIAALQKSASQGQGAGCCPERV